MAERWEYHVAVFVQTAEGRGGVTGVPVVLDHAINSFDIVAQVIEKVTKKLFPAGPPELPDGFPPITILTWTLVSAKKGPAVQPLAPKQVD